MSDKVVVIAEVHASPCSCGGDDIRTYHDPETDMWTTLCWPITNGCGKRTGEHHSSASALTRWNSPS